MEMNHLSSSLRFIPLFFLLVTTAGLLQQRYLNTHESHHRHGEYLNKAPGSRFMVVMKRNLFKKKKKKKHISKWPNIYSRVNTQQEMNKL